MTSADYPTPSSRFGGRSHADQEARHRSAESVFHPELENCFGREKEELPKSIHRAKKTA